MFSSSAKNTTRQRITGILSLILCLVMLISPSADAAGSININPDISASDYSRAHTEWYDAVTNNISRHQKVYVYVKAGEKILCGSSVTNGVDALGNANQNCDIVYYKPSSSSPNIIDVAPTAAPDAGYIKNRTQEVNGPYYTNSAGASLGSADGYTPCEITVGPTEEGVWTFEFHSAQKSYANPAKISPSATTPFSSLPQLGTVAAWDLTVVKDPDLASASVVTGRAFAYFLSLNTGSNDKARIYPSVYVLTSDGYVYKTDFNGLNPYGFIFFANNRGLTVPNGTSTASLYASAAGSVSSSNLSKPTVDGTPSGAPVSYHLPTVHDTELDQTFKIFFETPADDLPTTIKPIPYAPGQVTDFRFVGDSAGHGYVSEGGYFYFNVTRASSFQIKMDFSNYSPDGGTTFINGGTVYLANACVDGENRIYWDGKDGMGNVVPAGTYGSGAGSSGIHVEVDVKAGEYHFPILDAEYNLDGVKIHLENDPLDSNGNPLYVDEAVRSSVYFDNTVIFENINGTQYSAAELDEITGLYKIKALDTPVDTSTHGAAAYKYKRTAKYGGTAIAQGDNAVIDLWTYYKGNSTATSTELDSFILVDPPATPHSDTIDGFVFYDVASSGTFRPDDGDYELSGITVELRDSANNLVGTQVTDIYGEYSFVGVSPGTYTITVIKPSASATCTTANLTQSVTLVDARIHAADVGFHYPTTDTALVVYKVWSIDKTLDPNQPDSVKITITGEYGGSEYFKKDAVVSLSNGWKTTFQGLPKYADQAETKELVYSVSETKTDAEGPYIEDALGNKYRGYTGTVAKTNTSAEYTEYTLTNNANCCIVVKKTDAYITDKPVPGATFTLYDKLTGTALKTAVSDADGIATFWDLNPGTFYYVETSAAPGYIIDTAPSADITLTQTPTGFRYVSSMTNTPLLFTDFTVTKTLTAPSDRDEEFMYRVTGPDGTMYVTLTVTAGATAATATLKGMLVGDYTVTETALNWRYTLKADALSTNASDGTNTYSLSGGALTMYVGQTGTYSFNFTNELTNTGWSDSTAVVVNTMHPLS